MDNLVRSHFRVNNLLTVVIIFKCNYPSESNSFFVGLNIDTRSSLERKRKFDDCYVYYDNKILVTEKSRSSKLRSIRKTKEYAEEIEVLPRINDSTELVQKPKKAFKMCSLDITKTFVSKLEVMKRLDEKCNDENEEIREANSFEISAIRKAK